MKTRLQSLGLLDRAVNNLSDADLSAAIAALGDEHRAALDELVGGSADVARVRETATKGRLDGTLESIALVLTDACLADCIEQLGDHADNPTSDQLREVLPGVIERNGLGMTQLMLASTVAGEAPAAPMIRDLLKNDDTVKLPPAEHRPIAPIVELRRMNDEDRELVKAKRKEMKQRKQDEARIRREQSVRDRGR